MPQLNPAPWFTILIFSWLVFTIIIPVKVISHTFPDDPASQSMQKLNMDTWNWPWL